jgi:dUTP pyrophosphatase
MKIYIKYHNQNCKLESFGNWIDLKSAETVTLKPSEFKLINLGCSMRLPKWYQANIVPRSSTYKKFGIIQANHYGVVDGADDKSDGYSGNNDIYMLPAIALKDCQINEGDRICQFEIRLSMKAPWYIKLKWLFNNKIIFIEVDDLKTVDRGGFGTSGK